MAKHARDLTPEQVQAFKKIVGRHLRFYGRLVKRMDQLHFSPSDPIYEYAVRSHNAALDLNSQLHYLTCKPGTVGR